MTMLTPYRITRDSSGGVQIRRLMDVDRALIGVEAHHAPALSARLHALCPHAHRIATAGALGAPQSAEDQTALKLELRMACVLRLAVTWPLALGLAPHRSAGAARRAYDAGDVAELNALLGEIGLAVKPWSRNLAAKLGPIVDPTAPTALLALRFEAMRNQALRLAKRTKDVRVTSANGFCEVETLRGPLQVRVLVKGGRIMRFESSAPSDRLFVRSGPVAQVCAVAKDEHLARMAILALDPCIGYGLDFSSGLGHA